MLSGVGTLRAGRPARPGASGGTNAPGARVVPQNKPQQQPRKRSREPCEDERAHKALSLQRDQLLRAISTQSRELVSLEKEILGFHYAHTLCLHEDQPPAAVAPQTMEGTSLSSPGCRPAGAMTPAYYEASEVAQLRHTLRVQLEEHRKQEADATARWKALEEQVDREIVKGLLAKQQSIAAEEEAAYVALLKALEHQRYCSRALAAEIASEGDRAASLERAGADCTQRKAVLEEKKRNQMANVAHTRQELQAAKEALQTAQRTLKRREAMVRELRQEIDRRRERLRRRKAAN